MHKTQRKYWDKPPTSTGAGFLNHQQYLQYSPKKLTAGSPENDGF